MKTINDSEPSNLDKNEILFSGPKKNSFFKKNRLIPVVTLFALLGIYSFLEPFWIEEKLYTIDSPNIPHSFNDYRIIFLTDIHHGRFFSRSRIRNLILRVKELNPDIILLGGDYVEGSPEYIKGCFEELGKLHAPFGVFGVLGNHDHWQGADITRNAMTSVGISSIDNGAYWITKDGQRIKVGGVGDHCEDVQNLDITVDDVELSDFVILISHSPDYAQELKSDKVDLVLSGHNHGGQITFFGLFAPKVPSRYGQKFRTGKVILNTMQVVISNGIGTTLLPIRFFARPQIVIVKLKTKQ